MCYDKLRQRREFEFIDYQIEATLKKSVDSLKTAENVDEREACKVTRHRHGSHPQTASWRLPYRSSCGSAPGFFNCSLLQLLSCCERASGDSSGRGIVMRTECRRQPADGVRPRTDERPKVRRRSARGFTKRLRLCSRRSLFPRKSINKE